MLASCIETDFFYTFQYEHVYFNNVCFRFLNSLLGLIEYSLAALLSVTMSALFKASAEYMYVCTYV